MNCTGYPSYFDEEFDCEELFCETCTFDCWKKEGDDP